MTVHLNQTNQPSEHVRNRARKQGLIGLRFGRLLILDVALERGSHLYYKAQCDCGSVAMPQDSSLKRGNTQSCGCLKKERIAETIYHHGHAKKPQSSTYRIWHGIKSRCLDTRYKDYQNYGARGITVCERWLRFENFLADMGERPSADYSVDRIDNNGNYEPANCRWATRSQQRNNSSQPTTIVEYQGQRKPLAEWASDLGVDRKWLYSRIVTYGWTPERAFTEPKAAPNGRRA